MDRATEQATTGRLAGDDIGLDGQTSAPTFPFKPPSRPPRPPSSTTLHPPISFSPPLFYLSVHNLAIFPHSLHQTTSSILLIHLPRHSFSSTFSIPHSSPSHATPKYCFVTAHTQHIYTLPLIHPPTCNTCLHATHINPFKRLLYSHRFLPVPLISPPPTMQRKWSN